MPDLTRYKGGNVLSREKFKKVEGFSHYFISDRGRVLSLWHGRLRALSPYIVAGGYLMVKLVADDKSQHQRYVHRLVAQAFIENPDNLPEINHKDENKANNSLENLEWCSRLYNMRYGTWATRATLTKQKKGFER